MKKFLTLFSLMGIMYVFIEVAFTSITSLQPRLVGQSSLWIMLVGGLAGVILGSYNGKSKTPYPFQVIYGALLIISIEFLSGLILNKYLGFNIWDYSSNRFNLLGQIDLFHSICWLILTPFVFWIDDVMRYYLYGSKYPDDIITYYRDILS